MEQIDTTRDAFIRFGIESDKLLRKLDEYDLSYRSYFTVVLNEQEQTVTFRNYSDVVLQEAYVSASGEFVYSIQKIVALITCLKAIPEQRVDIYLGIDNLEIGRITL